MKNRVTAGLLAIFLGGIGIHKFYLGQTGVGVIYLLFCWTGIPSLIGLIEGIIMITQSDEDFKNKQGLDNVANTAGTFGGGTNSNADELKKYAELYDSGAIDKDEYDKKKKELL